MRNVMKTEIEEQKQRIAALEPQVAEAKAATAAALHRVNVQTRYASRVQSVIRSQPDSFVTAMEALIDADKLASLARGK
jgi:cell division septum initiation protein DivIVA